MNKKRLVQVVLALALLVSTLPAVAMAAAPSNDDFAGSVAISALPFTDSRNITEATSASNDPYSPCNGTGSFKTVWYSFTPASNMRLEANTLGSSYDTVLSVHFGSPGNFLHLTCNDDSSDASGLHSQVGLNVAAGQTYHFLVGAYTATESGNLTFNLTSLPAPANDDFNNAITIATLPFMDTRDTTTATRANDDPSACIYPDATVWYSFTATTNMRVEASTSGSNFFTTTNVFTGSRGALSHVGCAFSPHSPLLFNAVAGQTYHFMVGSLSGGGNLVFRVTELAAPANDDFDNATVITALPFSDALNTAGATSAPDDPTACSFFQQSSLWYSFTPPTNMRIEVDTSGSGYPPSVGVYVGTRGALTNINCSFSQVSRFEVVAGQTYYFMVTGSNYGSLNFTLRAAPPPLAIEISVSSFGTVVPTTGVATINGTVTCNQPSYINMSGTVTQKVGRGVIYGYIYVYTYCDGTTPTTWSSIAYSQPGAPIGGGRAATLFTGGRAATELFANAYSETGYEFAQDTHLGSITLRGSQR